MQRILIVEDEAVIRGALRRLLERNAYEVADAESVEQARAEHNPQDFHLILTDVRLPGAPGTAMLEHSGDVPVILMTSYASVRSAVDAIKDGAADYIAKPFEHDELLVLIERVLRQHKTERTQAALQSEVDQSYPVDGMVGQCLAMRDICERIGKVAPTDATVLVLGESGTGKELAARAIHARSKRSDGPFVTVNCAAIPENLIESELFGHEKGAFNGADSLRTGLIESAEGGTLFLDEVGELPINAQARLLRVLQNGEVRRVGSEQSRRIDVRVVAATHRDLKRAVAQGEFRDDLYFRLRVVELSLPPLRERGDDILELAQFMLDKACRQLNKPAMQLDAGALKLIRQHNWPGNVRELENAMERAVILCEGGVIDADLLGIEPLLKARNGQAADLSLEDYFRQFVLEHQDHMTETELARRLGISRKALWERRQRFALPRARKGAR
jgi:DNA-binding NtrC family response regulator